jgi:dienelactone hydrolase
MASRHADALRSMRGIFVDAGRSDEFFLEVAATAFSAELGALGVEHRFELFDGGHGSIEYRYPQALRYLSERIYPEVETR